MAQPKEAARERLDNVFRYVYSSSLHERIQIKVVTLEGFLPKPTYEQLLEDPLLRFSGVYSENCPSLKVRLQVFNNGKPFGLPVTTSYKAFIKRYSWNEWVTLPVLYSDLPGSAVLGLTILDCAGANKTTVIGGTTIAFFGKNGMYRQGMFDMRVWVGRESDGNAATETPGIQKDVSKHQMQRLAKLSKKHRNGQIRPMDWLDRLTFREIELINEREKQESDYLFLLIEFQTVDSANHTYSILYYEPDGDTKYSFIAKPKLVTVPDSEILQDNLVEKKHHRLARSERSDLLDRDLKPNSFDRDYLHNMVHVNPPNYIPNSEEQDLIWKFRFHLSTDRHALVIFLRCINWETATEVRQALTLMGQWDPMDGSDALALLCPDFTQPALRRYAISRLQESSDEELLLYLLQLVQALKYENLQEFEDQLTPEPDVIQSIDDTPNQVDNQDSTSQSAIMTNSMPTSSLGSSFIARPDAPPDLMFASDTSAGQMSDTEAALNQLNLSSDNNNPSESGSINSNTLLRSTSMHPQDFIPTSLSSFLVHRACCNPTLVNYLYWYLYIECETHEESIRKPDIRVQAMYKNVLRTLKKTLDEGTPVQKHLKHTLDKQQNFIDELVKLVKLVAKESGNRKKKTDRFQQLLADPDAFHINFTRFDPIPFPLDPEVLITGIIPDKVMLFKSALMPSKLTFTTTTGTDYVAIFKYGDDLRQDQLIMQMITLMDRLLRCENLDLKLTPYRVLATSSKHGFMQFIDSVTVAEACNAEGNLQNFFRKHHPSETGLYGIEPEVMDTYIKSCAGYCVITYLLGVGDRHLDNLLLTTSGNLFHIDFGYILGRDPKPMPPPMKLSKEMVDAMGGISSDTFKSFRKLCYTAYLHLRRQSKVMLNLFALMVDASIPDIALEPDKAVKKVEENLQMSLNDEAAIQHLQNVMDESVSAFMPAMLEQIHKLAQYWRR